MGRYFVRLLYLILFAISFYGHAQEYYPEYRGDEQTAYISFHAGMSSAVGTYRSNSLAGNGLALAFNKGTNPIVNAYRFLGKSKMRMAYDYGFSITAQRLEVKPLQSNYNIAFKDTSRYTQFAGGGSVRLIQPLGDQASIELNAGVDIVAFLTPVDYSFFYITDNGQEEFRTTFTKRGMMRLSPHLGVTLRYWKLGLNAEYNWFNYNTETVIEAVNSEVISTFDFNGQVQSLRITLAYYLPR